MNRDQLYTTAALLIFCATAWTLAHLYISGCDYDYCPEKFFHNHAFMWAIGFTAVFGVTWLAVLHEQGKETGGRRL